MGIKFPKFGFLKKDVPDSDLPIGLAGCGSFVQHAYLPALNNDQLPFNISGVYSRTVKSLKNFEKKYKYKVFKTTEFEELLNSGIKGLILVLPDHLHYEYARRALERGINVFCEKPICNHLSEAMELKAIAERENAILMVGYNLRYSQRMNRMKQFLSEGIVGEVKQIEGMFHMDVEKHIRSSSWLNDQDKNGGGVLGNVGCHLINTVQFMLDDIDSVSAKLSNNKLPKEYGDDTAQCSMHFKNGITLDLDLSFVSQSYVFRRSLLYKGAKGELLVDEDIKFRPKGREDWEQKYNVKEATEDSVFQELCHFYDCIKNRKKPETDIDDAIKTLKIVKAAYTAVQNN